MNEGRLTAGPEWGVREHDEAMGISGHILGPRKLRKLSALTGLPLDRAYIRNQYAEGVIWTDTGCEHHAIDPRTGNHERITNPVHWTSCDPRSDVRSSDG